MELDNGNQWDRVAAELRACRESQLRAWGDIDNTTLGRFLAGEVTPDEQRQIENALDELPELRKLTELVRDVLGESEVAAPEPASAPSSVPYGPAILPFPQLRPQYRSAAPTPAPKRGGRPWLHNAHFRQRAGLVAAAGVLLVLGFTLPRSGGASGQAEQSLVLSQPFATHVTAFEPNDRVLAANFDREEKAPLLMRSSAPKGEEQDILDRVSASVLALKTEGKPREAETLARQYTSNLTRKALVYQEKGDLARAEPALHQASALCDRTWGPEAPESVRTRNSLAGVYEVALNTMPPSPYLSQSADANPYFTQRTEPAPYAPTNPYDRHAVKPPPPAAVYLYNAPPRPSRAAPPSSPPQRKQHLKAASGTHSHSGHAIKETAYKVTHSHHSVRMPPSAVALRDRLTRKTQAELKASVVPVLSKALREAASSPERQRLARALGQLGPVAGEAVPLLIGCYHRATEPAERAALLSTLTDIGPTARYRFLDLAKRAAMAAPPPEVLQCLNSLEGRNGIVDRAECFSLNAIRQSQDQIRHLAKTYHIEVVIETVPAKVAAIADMGLAENGVYLCIHKDVPSVQVHVSEALRKQGLTDAQLRQTLEPHLHKHDFDRGLQASVAFLADFEGKQAGK